MTFSSTDMRKTKKKKKERKTAKTQYVKEDRKSISFPKIGFHRAKCPSFDLLSSQETVRKERKICVKFVQTNSSLFELA